MNNINVITIVSKTRFHQNSYLCFNDHIMILVDCGCEKEDFIEAVKAHSLDERRLNAILLTHTHFDHIWGLYDIWQMFGCDIYLAKGCEEFIYDKERNASSLFEGFVPSKIYPECIKSISDKDTISFGQIKIVAYRTAGHTECSMCFLMGDILFTGDTILEGTVGRTDLCGGSNLDLVKSLAKIKKIHFEFAYPGHGAKMSKEMVNGLINFYVN